MYWVRVGVLRVAEDRLRAETPAARTLAAADAVLAIDGASVAGLQARARARHDAAQTVWLGPIEPGRDRRVDTTALLGLARQDLTAALRVSPTHPSLHEGASDTALEHLRAAVALEPSMARFRERLARRLWDSAQYFQAINEWQAIKNLIPTDVDARMSLARAYEKIGQRSTAYNEYRAILDVSPHHPAATRALARFR